MEKEETQKPPTVDHTLEQAEVPDVARIFAQYGRPILLAAGVAVAVYLAFTVVGSRKAQANADAERMLATGDADQLAALIAQYPSSPAAAGAELQLARTDYERGEFEKAMGRYEAFATQRPTHPLALSARLNVALCLEALDRTDAARTAYEAFARDHAGHFLAAQAVFGEARCLEKAGQYAEAKAKYEDYRAANPESPWNQVSEAAVRALDMKIRAARASAQAPAAAPAPTAPPTPAAAPVAPAAAPAKS